MMTMQVFCCFLHNWLILNMANKKQHFDIELWELKKYKQIACSQQWLQLMPALNMIQSQLSKRMRRFLLKKMPPRVASPVKEIKTQRETKSKFILTVCMTSVYYAVQKGLVLATFYLGPNQNYTILAKKRGV